MVIIPATYFFQDLYQKISYNAVELRYWWNSILLIRFECFIILPYF